jgi:hypothetical protein
MTRKGIRDKNSAYADPSFDGAFYLASVSSEESESEDEENPPFPVLDGAPPARKPQGRIITHPPAWRSQRLFRFYELLDEEHALKMAGQPKRGAGKKERVRGPPREAGTVNMPPKGVSGWMVSERWKQEMRRTHSFLDSVLTQVMEGTQELPGEAYTFLGQGSEEEGEYADA